MATYAIGDIQGCYAELVALYEKLSIDPALDRLILVGDLVNRGPESLAVLRWAQARQDHVDIVLGNHDLHLLAVHAGHGKLKVGDTLKQVLDAEDASELMIWLRAQPLVRRTGDWLFVHAGLLPQWSADQAVRLSKQFGAALAGIDGEGFLAAMYGNRPERWSDTLDGVELHRLLVNACTRMRMVDPEGAIDYKFKGALADAPSGRLPWFDHPLRQSRDCRVVCGHWSALGLVVRPDLVALDTGCVWGGSLTAIRLDDDQLFSEPSRQPRVDTWE